MIYFILRLCFSILLIFSHFAILAAENASVDEDGKQDLPKKNNVVIKYEPKEELITEKILYETLDYSTIKEQCEKLLSPDAYILTLPERNMIIVHDTAAKIAKIRELIGIVDSPAVNIRIDIISTNTGSAPNDRFSADIKHNDPKEKSKIVIVDKKIQKPKEINIDIVKGEQRTTRNNSTFLVTQSGKPASIFAGKEIVDPNWLLNYKLVPTVIVVGGGGVVKIPGSTPDFVWRNVGSSLKILPILKDNGMIEVQVYPEISYIDGEGKKQAVKVESVTTTLTVANGQTIPLGGVIDKHREFYYNLFGPEFRRTGGGGVLDMQLKATVIPPRNAGSEISPATKKDPNSLNYIERGENPHDWRR